MKRFCIALLSFVSTMVLGAAHPDDGILLRAEGEPAPWIVSQDGQKVFLGARQELKIQKSEIFSQDNANTRFYLTLTVPYDKTIGPSTYVLLIGGTAYRQAGSGASREETSSLSFYISGEDKAKEVSQFFNVPLLLRRHPRHSLLVSFIPAQQEFGVGEDVTAKLRIKNVGTNNVSFMKGGRNRAARDNQYVFSARRQGRQVDDIGTSYHRGGLAGRQVLKPEELFEDTISLSKWFAFAEPGIYEILGSYYLDLKDPDSGSWRTIWEDYVSADFIVRIEEPRTSNKVPEDTARKLADPQH